MTDDTLCGEPSPFNDGASTCNKEPHGDDVRHSIRTEEGTLLAAWGGVE